MKSTCTILILTAVCAQSFKLNTGNHYVYKTELHISNYEGAIAAETFSSFANITELHLVQSKITQIKDGALCTSPLAAIFLQDNDLLPKITKEMFGNCSTLIKLDINGPFDSLQIESDAFSQLSNLKELYMKFVPTKSIQRLNWNGLSKLQFLKIYPTNLKGLDAFSLGSLESLKKINLGIYNIRDRRGNFTHKLMNMLTLGNENSTEAFWDSMKNLEEVAWLDFKNSRKRYETQVFAVYKPKQLKLEVQVPLVCNEIFDASYLEEPPLRCKDIEALSVRSTLKSRLPNVKLKCSEKCANV